MKLDLPGFIDVHVHFRDPGMTEAENMSSGIASAKRGGFAAVVTMPNTKPACDSPELIGHQRRLDGDVLVFPSAAITKGRLGREVSDIERLAECGAAFFTDDGSYVSDARVMEDAMRRVAKLGMVVCEHAMDPAIQAGGVIRDCALARRLGLPVIRPETEVEAIRRDVSICRETGCRLHIQHISTAGGVELVRMAQREGLPVTAEATPHHILLSCDEITADDANFKMAPPLGNDEDRVELRKAVKDGVLMFATDHAPHPAATKSLGFAKSANGIIGLECAVAITYSVMVEREGMPVESWAKAWSDMPRKLLPKGMADLAAKRVTSVDTDALKTVDVDGFASLSRNCPYGGMSFRCWPV